MRKIWLMVMILEMAGCASQPQVLDDQQGSTVIQTAVERAQRKMSCSDVVGKVLSQQVIQPAVQGAYIVGVKRTEHTVDVTGCSKKDTYVVVCPVGGNECFATDSRNR